MGHRIIIKKQDQLKITSEGDIFLKNYFRSQPFKLFGDTNTSANNYVRVYALWKN